MDALVTRFDFGSDPLRYYARRIELANEVWGNMEKKLEKPGEGYQVLRRSFNVAMGQAGYSLFLTAKYIGGVYHYRAHVGDPGNLFPFEPVPAAKQREPLDFLGKTSFSRSPHASGTPVIVSPLNPCPPPNNGKPLSYCARTCFPPPHSTFPLNC